MKIRVLIITIFVTLGFSCGKFDQKKWNDRSKEQEKQARYLIRDEILQGKSYQEIVQLLGEEDLRPSLTDSCRFKIEYIVGGYWIDFRRLEIKFDSCKVVAVGMYDN